MEKVDALLGRAVAGARGKGVGGGARPGAAAAMRPVGKHVRRAHRPQIVHQRRQRAIAQRHPVDIDDGHDEPGRGQQRRQRRRFDARMGALRDAATRTVGLDQRCAQHGQAVAASHCADQRRVGGHRAADEVKRQMEVVDRVERTHRDDQIEASLAVIVGVFLRGQPARGGGEQRTRIDHLDRAGKAGEADRPVRARCADQQRAGERTAKVAEPIEAFVESTGEQHQLGAEAGSAITAAAAEAAVEQVWLHGVGRHGGACAAARLKQQGGMLLTRTIRGLGQTVLDFALPPRCAGCAEVVERVDDFCVKCWSQIEWLGSSGCTCCGLPLEGTEAEYCGRCLAAPPPLERMRAAVAYGDLPRSIALRLKYGRKVALARTMARYMAPLRGEADDAVIVPVPLHRRRLWSRGFNQSGLVARELGKHWHLPVEQHLLKRIKATQPLKGMNHHQRQKAVAGAFGVAPGTKLDGRPVILIDDVLTSGSTAEACARALRKGGAGRVELISWARVVRPSLLMR